MSDPINLRRARKDKARREKEEEAKANRILHGRTKAERERIKGQQELERRQLDGHKRGE